MRADTTKKITSHCFRHTYATLRVPKYCDIYTVSKLLKHKNIKATQIYPKVIDQERKKAVKRIPSLGLKLGGMRMA